MPETVKGRRRIAIVLAIVAILIALFAVWRTWGVEQTATDLGGQVATACRLDASDAQRKGLNCAQAEAVSDPSPVTLTQPPVTNTLLVPGPVTVVTETNQVPLPLPTVVPLPGLTVVSVTPGPTVTKTDTSTTTVVPPPQTVTETQTQTETVTATTTVSCPSLGPCGPEGQG